MPGVVDLATSPARTEALEAWCVLRSHFLIGSDSVRRGWRFYSGCRC
jgi:hypothetical protein